MNADRFCALRFVFGYHTALGSIRLLVGAVLRGCCQFTVPTNVFAETLLANLIKMSSSWEQVHVAVQNIYESTLRLLQGYCVHTTDTVSYTHLKATMTS